VCICRIVAVCAAVLYLQQEDLARLRKRVVECEEVHRALVKELDLIVERKAELTKSYEETMALIQFGKMPQPPEMVLEVAQSPTLKRFDSRRNARRTIL
jgi:hypothetical protein